MNVTRGVFARVRAANWRAIAMRPRVYRGVLGTPINASEQQRFFVSTSFFDGWKNRIKTAFGLDNPEVFSDKQGNFFAESKEKNLNNDYNYRINRAKGDAARRLFAEMKEKNIKTNAGTYNAMIRVVGEIGGDIDGARRLFAKMKEKNIQMNAGTYNDLIHTIGDVNDDVDGARKLVEVNPATNKNAETKEKNRNNDYKNRINSAKGPDAARRLFAEMKEKNIEMNAGTYNAMIRVVGEIGRDVEGARSLLAEMNQKFF